MRLEGRIRYPKQAELSPEDRELAVLLLIEHDAP
jgi:hypothetical protein